MNCEKFYYIHRKEGISACVDEKQYGEKFHGLTVMQPEAEQLNEYYIVITQDNYPHIKEKLIKYGLEEFEDFIYWKHHGKKLAVLHGNCYISIIKQYLEGNILYMKTIRV